MYYFIVDSICQSHVKSSKSQPTRILHKSSLPESGHVFELQSTLVIST